MTGMGSSLAARLTLREHRTQRSASQILLAAQPGILSHVPSFPWDWHGWAEGGQWCAKRNDGPYSMVTFLTADVTPPLCPSVYFSIPSKVQVSCYIGTCRRVTAQLSPWQNGYKAAQWQNGVCGAHGATLPMRGEATCRARLYVALLQFLRFCFPLARQGDCSKLWEQPDPAAAFAEEVSPKKSTNHKCLSPVLEQ